MGEADISSGNVTRAGLILTGGGARAAYQVGVLKALSQIHARPDWPFPIIVGTSAGAVWQGPWVKRVNGSSFAMPQR